MDEDQIAHQINLYLESVREYLMDYCRQEQSCDDKTIRAGLDAYISTNEP
jgi:hypothetical protein